MFNEIPPARNFWQAARQTDYTTPAWMRACQGVVLLVCIGGLLTALINENKEAAIIILSAILCLGVGIATTKRISEYNFRKTIAVAGGRRIAVYIEGEDVDNLHEDALAALTQLGLQILQHNRVPAYISQVGLFPENGQQVVAATPRPAAATPAAPSTIPVVTESVSMLNQELASTEVIAQGDESDNESTSPVDSDFVWGRCEFCNNAAIGQFALPGGTIAPLCPEHKDKKVAPPTNARVTASA